MTTTRQVVLDTETTGLDPKSGHRIIEIGCCELVNRRYGEEWHAYINPEREVDVGAFKVHGLSNAFLREQPVFSAIYSDFLDFIKGAELIIHNAPFDVGFINAEFVRCQQGIKEVSSIATITDTLVMARALHPGQRNSLDALCQRYEVDASRRDLHGALLDAQLLAEVYLRMTGGQRVLFSEEEASATHQQALVRGDTQLGKCYDISVVQAEDEAHVAYLQPERHQ